MNSQQPPQYDEPTNKTALALSAAVHGALIAALFFGVQWKNEQSGGMPVDVYYGNPAASLPPPRPAPEPVPAPVPEQKPLAKPEPKAAETPKIDPQIAIKDKERREKEEKEKLEKERLEKEQAEKLKKQKLEEEEKQKEAIRKEKEEKTRKEEEQTKKREQKEKEARRAAELAKEAERDLKHAQQQRSSETVRGYDSAIDAELKGLRGSPNGSPTGSSSGTKGSAGNASSRGKDAYSNKIKIKIRGNIVLPPSIQGNPEAIFKVTQLPSGEIIDIKLTRSSGNRALDEAIERAIKKSDPLPLPDQPSLFERVLELKYKPFNE